MKKSLCVVGLVGCMACDGSQTSQLPGASTMAAGSAGRATTTRDGSAGTDNAPIQSAAAGASHATTGGVAPATLFAGASSLDGLPGQGGASQIGMAGATALGGAGIPVTSRPTEVGGFAAGGRVAVTTSIGATAGRTAAGGTVTTIAATVGTGGMQLVTRAGASAGGVAGSSSPSTVQNGGSAGATVISSTPPARACPNFARETSSNRIKLTANPTNNYSFFSEIRLTSQSVAEQSDLEFNWSTLTRDMYGRAIDPKADIGGILVTIWSLAKAELEQKINSDDLATSDRRGAGYLFTQKRISETTASHLTSDGREPLTASTLDAYFDATEFPADESTYLVMLQSNGSIPGKDGRMFATFSLSTDPKASKTVTIDNSSATLEFAADFSRLAPTLVPADTGDMTIDWANLATSAMGRVVDPYYITRVVVASYTLPVSELQKNENFINLESLAVARWESNPDDIINPKLVLSKLKNASNGRAFAGIDSTHTWLLALQCGPCLNPAPWYIAVLQACVQ